MFKTSLRTSAAYTCQRSRQTLTRARASGRLGYATVSGSIPSLKVNPKRLLETIHSTCGQWGAAHRYGENETETGMSRLSLSSSDKSIRDWLVNELKALDCKVTIDQMGNIFGVRPGRDGRTAQPPTAMGSHLDTQPNGGRYDGILGVMSALEGLRVLNENKIETNYPVALINWTNEEGARFPKSLHGSSVWAGSMSVEDGWDVRDVSDQSISTKAELERIGYLGSTPCSWKETPLAGHFELHIEQGPILESSKSQIGVVLGAQGYKWCTVEVFGRSCHTGTTPFHARSDPMLGAARIISMSHEVAKKYGGLGSTGILTHTPKSINTVPSHVSLTLDLRHLSPDKLSMMSSEILERANVVADPCEVQWKEMFSGPTVSFDERNLSSIESAVASLGNLKSERIWSGAGHDSCAVSIRCPTGMIFIPCLDGVSHNPREYSSPEDCVAGAEVLLNSVIAFDAGRTD